jgi:meso-butanediol dehydrogenase/(S,S)-butanediol dehydrogenase/diacetyl reductase
MNDAPRGGAIVTGAASGIGRAIAEGLSAEGFSLVIADIDEKLGCKVANEISSATGGRTAFAQTDVTDRAQLRKVVAQCREEFGSIKVMVNNAGFNKPEPFLEATEEMWRKILDVNALGVLMGIQESAKAMIEFGTQGKIINIASITGRTGFADFAPYSVSKAAVISLTQSGARALASHGITVNAIAPGVVATPLWEQLDADLMAMGVSSAPGEAIASLENDILLGRVATPRDIVGTALFLSTEGSDYMTGQTLMIDGGMILQ